MATCDIDPFFIRGDLPIGEPFPLGHEAVGEVVAVGSAVATVSVGDRVVLTYYDACGRCGRCRANRPNRCLEYSPDAKERAWHGVGLTPVGYFSELLRVRHADAACTPLPAGLEPASVASLGDNIGFAYEFVVPHLADQPGAPVLVVGGGGSIGLYAAAFAVAAGAGDVVYADTDAHRLTLAEHFGATPVERAGNRSLGSLPVTVDASADPDGLIAALRSTEVEGQCSSIGGHFAPIALPLFEMYLRGVNFYTGPGRGRPNVAAAAALIGDKGLDLSSVASFVLPLSQAAEALAEPPLKAVFTQ